MNKDPPYRYFLGFRPHESLRVALVAIAKRAGQQLRSRLLHLTLCVVAENEQRDAFLGARVGAALDDQALSSCMVRLGRVHAGPHGALLRTIGRQPDIQDFYRKLLYLLDKRDIAPLRRKSGLRPHVTLGYGPCRFYPFDVALEWMPNELLLIESEVGKSVHHVIASWPLLPPAQGMLCFDTKSQPWPLAV